MGHLVNPVTFRLSKSKFWLSVWNNYNKKNFKKYFLEDLNCFYLYKWLVQWINYRRMGVKVLDINFFKTFKCLVINISIMFDEDQWIDVVQDVDVVYKKFFFDDFLFKVYVEQPVFKNGYKIGNVKKIENFYLNARRWQEQTEFNYLKCYSSYFEDSLSYFFQKKKTSLSYFFQKKRYFKYSRSRRYFFRKKKKVSVFLNTGYFTVTNKKKKCHFFSWTHQVRAQLRQTTSMRYPYPYLQRRWWRVLDNFIKSRVILKQACVRVEQKFEDDDIFMPMRFILVFLKKFLEYYIKNIFAIKAIFLYFFEKSAYRFSTRYLKRFIKFEVHIKGYRVKHIMNLIRKDLSKDVSILGFKLGFFGRYQKKLRNRDFYRLSGSIAPSNLNSTVSYENFVVLLKQGVCGIELNVMKRMKVNVIF